MERRPVHAWAAALPTASALANMAGYTAALAALHPNDDVARSRYRGRLSDVRTIAGLEPLTGGGHLVAVDKAIASPPAAKMTSERP